MVEFKRYLSSLPDIRLIKMLRYSVINLVKTAKSFTLAAVLLLFSSCSIWDFSDWGFGGTINAFDSPPTIVNGMRPVYSPQNSTVIESLPPQPIINITQTASSGDLLFSLDLDLGVHVVNNADPRQPLSISFIQVPGIRTMSVDSRFLYANNFADLVTIDISDPTNARLVDRDPNFYQSFPEFPPNFNGWFECYDPARGFLLDWENAILENPECRI